MRRYSAREVAAALGLHPRTVRRHVQRGHLPVIRSPSGYFMNITEQGLTEWMRKEVFAHALHHSPGCLAAASRRARATKPTDSGKD